MSTLVLVPSRGRPKAAAELLQTFEDTHQSLGTELVFVLDEDDPTRRTYPGTSVVVSPSDLDERTPLGMNAALNAGARLLLDPDPDVTVVGFVGDDHRFRTSGWDVAFEDALKGGGIAYCDDLFQRMRLPTMWFVSRGIVDAFGMGHPSLRHLYIDDYWKTLGEAADCLYYLADVVIEHMHPLAGKGEWDDGYRRANHPDVYTSDEKSFHAWVRDQMAGDVAKLKGLL